jgi:hypothetical protein
MNSDSNKRRTSCVLVVSAKRGGQLTFYDRGVNQDVHRITVRKNRLNKPLFYMELQKQRRA